MKVSLNWIKEYTDVDLPVDELVQKIGAQLGAVEEVVDIGKRYEGIVIAKVMKCEKHPNADKLSLCTVDDGGRTPDVERVVSGEVQVVCGAPNVREGMMVAWLPPGAIVPSTYDKDPFSLEAREIRGYVSNGMIASARELAVSDDHGGILEIDQDIELGTPFAEAYKLDDHIVDIENKMFTHRPDCFGMLGVAREIAGISHKQFTSPDWYIKENEFEGGYDEHAIGLSVTNDIPELCHRYMAVTISGVKVGPSPVWLQSYLSRVGIRPINNIVDMTNYMMVLTGQPLHAFDFDKLAVDGRAEIVVRNPHKGETMTLLDGKTIEPRADAILICDPHKPIALGGVMGGNNSEIDENTTRIIIECANFDMYNIRKTAMEHGIFSDSVTRFTKGQSPLQCVPVLYKAVQITQEVSPDANPIGETVDVYRDKAANAHVEVTVDFINARLGLSLGLDDMAGLLRNVEFDVGVQDQLLQVTAPFWRTDIHIAEDVVEEVGRLYGYDKLPLELPKRDLTPAKKDAALELKRQIRDVLASAGANEILTYSFVHGNLMERCGQDKEQAFKLANALSPDLQYYRMSLSPSLLERVHSNIKAGYDEFAIFEIGKTHIKKQYTEQEPDAPAEFERAALVFAADGKSAQKYGGAAYYQAKKYLMYVLEACGLASDVTFDSLEPGRYEGATRTKIPQYEVSRSATIRLGDVVVGEIGQYRAAVRQSLKLPDFCAGFELDVSVLLQSSGKKYVPLPKFPKVEQDVSLRAPADVAYGSLFDFVRKSIEDLKPPETLATLQPVDIFQRENDKGHKHITLRLTIASYERTMTAEEVNTLLDKVAAAAKEKFGAERI